MERRRSRAVEEVKEASKKTEVFPPEKRLLLPTGSTLLNLAFSDSYEGGIAPGSMINIVGDSSAGKTFVLWTIFAEVARHPDFKHYRLIYDESEAAFFMHIAKLFGLPNNRVETDIRSATIQDFYRNVLQNIKEERPCIYGLDSFDGVSSLEEQGRADDIEKGKDISGSYKIEKAKWGSEIFRNIVDNLESTDSVLIVVSQTRDNIGVTFGDKKTRSGGNALRFYSTHEIWLSVVGHEKAKEREIGANIRFRVKKNKLTGKRRDGWFTIFFDYGIDDITSCIDFLIDEKIWSLQKGGKILTGGDIFPDMNKKDLIHLIENKSMDDELHKLVGQTWAEIEEALKLDRKPRYSVDDIED